MTPEPRTPEERAFAAAAELAGPPTGGSGGRRRLSWLRVGTLFLGLAAVAGSIVAFRTVDRHEAAPVRQSTFMPYVDVTNTPQYAFEDASIAGSADFVLGFVVSSKDDACTPSWGGAYSLAGADTAMDLDRRIVRLRDRGGDAVASFGGAANDELATRCTDATKLAAAYTEVVQRYDLDMIDLDIEGDAASAPDVVSRRATAIAAVQKAATERKKPVQVWLTLPVTPKGLTTAGTSIVAAMLSAHVQVAGVNVMTMDYGNSRPKGMTLAAANRSALTASAGQLASAYSRAGIRTTAAQAWRHLGATPMIGQNDTPADRLTLADAASLTSFARAHDLRRLSMWSVNRDQACGPNYANVQIVSPNCSGIAQKTGAFGKVFARFDAGRQAQPVDEPTAPTSGSATANPSRGSAIVDDPATSPYAIWNPALSYPAGTKIVWHRNVYQAKWWTKGDVPDAPVASVYDTPWSLIGPVLPGEHPRPTPTLSAGTYPAWSATKVYRAGARVLYQGVGYQAKWYTSGDVPGTVVSDPGQTPWTLITTS